MVTAQGSDAGASRNPSVTTIEPDAVSVTPDFDVGGVALEIVDQTGAGFSTTLDQLTALDVAVRIAGSIARLRGYGVAP